MPCPKSTPPPRSRTAHPLSPCSRELARVSPPPTQPTFQDAASRNRCYPLTMSRSAVGIPPATQPPSAPPPPPRHIALTYLARVGYGSKGIIFLTLGLLAANAAIRSGDLAAPLPVDQRIAVRAIHHGPLGSILVAGLCMGLLCYSAWQSGRAILDPQNHGTQWPALLKRAWYLWLALLNLALAASAAALAVGLFSQGRYRVGPRTWDLTDVAVTLLSTHLVRHLLVIAGVLTAIYGIVRTAHALILQYQSIHNRRDASQQLRRWRHRAHRLNLVTRGILALAAGAALFLVGGYFNTGEDLQRAYRLYQHLLHERFGRSALITAAIILLAWGIYCLLRACRPPAPASAT